MASARKTVAFGFIGNTRDARGGYGPERWSNWRPTVALFQHRPELSIDRFIFLYESADGLLAQRVMEDIREVSPDTQIEPRQVHYRNPWDFEEVYTSLYQLVRETPFDLEKEEYLVHFSTGTNTSHLCWFLLTQSRRLPAQLVSTIPPKTGEHPRGHVRRINLDHSSKYFRITAMQQSEARDDARLLKRNIETRSQRFNELVERVARVAAVSRKPLLLEGPTGAGKSILAKQIYVLKKERHRLTGNFIEVNCATLNENNAHSELFGHKKGAFTGATSARPGLLMAAHGGVLFLDEVGELSLDVQAMLLTALETKRFRALGEEEMVESDFQLVAGTNRDLAECVHQGSFREDLYARLKLWRFKLPGLQERREDIDVNVEFELQQREDVVRFSPDARRAFLEFALAPESTWRGNFRDLAGIVERMATLAEDGMMDEPLVRAETARLAQEWRELDRSPGDALIERYLGPERARELDRFDRVQLAEVLRVCENSRMLSEAGRTLFEVSRKQRARVNDADRLRKYLAAFGLSFEQISREVTGRRAAGRSSAT